MSVRGLLVLALLLLVLCAGAGGLLLHRLGWLTEQEPVAWTFVNPTLQVTRGQRVVLRPILEGAPSLRYTFLVEMTEPPPDDPVAPVPHRRAGVDEYHEGDWGWRPPVEALAFCQLGALTAQEWLIEIAPLVERRGSGEERILLKAVFGHRSGAVVSYYHDPGAPVPVVGWERSELVAEGRPPEIHFASDGGLAVVPGEREEGREDGK